MNARRLRVVYAMDQMQDVRLVEGFARRFELTVLAPASAEPHLTTWSATGAPFSRAIVPGGRASFPVRGASWLVRRGQAHDLVIAQEELTAALAATLAGFFTRRPVILQLGRTTTEYYRCRRFAGRRGPGYWAGLGTVAVLSAFNQRRAAAVGASSRYIASRCHARIARAIPAYGVDPEIYEPRPSREEARRTLGLPADVPLVLWRSRLAPEKDLDTFLRAMALVRATREAALALYVGAEYRQIEALARAGSVPVVARDAVDPRRELPLFYRAADVVVQTSRMEGLGISPLEALACEVPVVASAVGGLTETIRHGDTGLTAPPGDAHATARAISWMLDHPEDALAMAQRGRALVLAEYRADRAFAEWEALAAEVGARVGTPEAAVAGGAQ